MIFEKEMNVVEEKENTLAPPSLYAKCVKPRGKGETERDRMGSQWSSTCCTPPNHGTRGLKQKAKSPQQSARVTDVTSSTLHSYLASHIA